MRFAKGRMDTLRKATPPHPRGGEATREACEFEIKNTSKARYYDLQGGGTEFQAEGSNGKSKEKQQCL